MHISKDREQNLCILLHCTDQNDQKKVNLLALFGDKVYDITQQVP